MAEALGMRQRQGVSRDDQSIQRSRLKGSGHSCLFQYGATEHLVSTVKFRLSCVCSKARGHPVEGLFSPSTM